MARPSRRKVNTPKRDSARPRSSDGKDAQSGQATDPDQPRLEELLLNSPAVSYICAPSGDYGATYVTPNIRAQLGYEPKDFTDDAHFWINHIHPDDRQRIQRNLSVLLKNDQHTHEYRFQHKDGTYRWMHDQLRLIRDSQGRPVKIVGHWMDVTLRKEAEDNLRESEASQQTLLPQNPSTESNPRSPWDARNRPGSQIQTVLFDAGRWSMGEAKDWLRKHGFEGLIADRTAHTIRFRQIDPGAFRLGSFRTIQLDPDTGIQAVVGIPR